MTERRRGNQRADRSRILILTGPVAVASAIAFVWGGSYLRPHRPAHAESSLTADAGANGGAAAGRLLTPRTIAVRVRLSAALERLVGNRIVTVTLPPGGTVGTLLNRLGEAYPVLASMGPSILVAVSDEAQPPDTVLANGQVVDLISQMSGG
jgi:molybdopterin converting factor small subunit